MAECWETDPMADSWIKVERELAEGKRSNTLLSECPHHRDTDGSPMKAILFHDGYHYCPECLRQVLRQWKDPRVQELIKSLPDLAAQRA